MPYWQSGISLRFPRHMMVVHEIPPLAGPGPRDRSSAHSCLRRVTACVLDIHFSVGRRWSCTTRSGCRGHSPVWSSCPSPSLAPASANPGGTGLVISEVYGGGGNSGATFKNDFIELYNPSGRAHLGWPGWSRAVPRQDSASGTGTGFTNLTVSVPATGTTSSRRRRAPAERLYLPTPDATGTLAHGSVGAGAVALVTGTVNPEDRR